MSSCINEVFMRNSKRSSKRTEQHLDRVMEERREKRLAKIKVAAAAIKDMRDKLAD